MTINVILLCILKIIKGHSNAMSGVLKGLIDSKKANVIAYASEEIKTLFDRTGSIHRKYAYLS